MFLRGSTLSGGLRLELLYMLEAEGFTPNEKGVFCAKGRLLFFFAGGYTPDGGLLFSRSSSSVVLR